MSSIRTTAPGNHGAVSHDECCSIQQPVSQHGDKIALDAAEHSVGHTSQSNNTAYDVVYEDYHDYEDWNKELADYLEIKNSNNEWTHSFQKMTYSLRSWFPYFSSKEALQQPPPQPPVELRPPPEAIRQFKSVLISQHFPVEITRKLAESANKWETVNTEWYMELRHFFIDLPTQLRELEELLTGTSSMSSTNDNEENKADTRALANWISYQLPAGFAGDSSSVSVYPHPRYPNLRHSRRIVFSQRLDIKDNHNQSDHNSRWLAGRWLVVAYLFAATPKAVQKLDVKRELLSACTPGRGNINTMSSLNAYNIVKHPLSMWPGEEKWWLLPTRDIFFQLQRCEDEMLATAFIPLHPDVYHRPYAYGYDHYSSDADYRRRLRDIERLRPLPFVRARHGHGHEVGGGRGGALLTGCCTCCNCCTYIPPELNNRCQFTDRMWPALMTGQDMKKQVECVKAAGTTCGDACDASSTTSSISSTSSTPSTSSTSSQNGTTTSDDNDDSQLLDTCIVIAGVVFGMLGIVREICHKN